ncbi:MAG TPA: TraB/GumN family protein [Burkholderiaceae bacterium]|jgi:hypothetical protein
MKNKISLIVIALLGFLTSFSYAENSSVPSAPAATASHRGTLYRVRHKGNTSYLFGTIHVGKPEFYPLGTEVMQAFSKASKVAFEIDLQDTSAIQASLQKHGMYGAGDSLKNHVSPDTLARLDQALKKVGLSSDSYMQMKPWVVADELMMLALAQGGYDPKQGIEEFLLKIAKQQKKRIVGLETADFQLSLFNRLTDEEQNQFLKEALDENSDGKTCKDADQLADAWFNADAKELARLAQDELSEKTVSAEFTQHVLLDQRNPGMATKIEGMLRHDKVTFVGVGLLHLIGEKSVPALLRQRGYAVELVY